MHLIYWSRTQTPLDSQQLRMDYITATWKVGLAHRLFCSVDPECYAILVSSQKWGPLQQAIRPTRMEALPFP